jgi:hypothetical protein
MCILSMLNIHLLLVFNPAFVRKQSILFSPPLCTMDRLSGANPLPEHEPAFVRLNLNEMPRSKKITYV